MKLVAIVLWLTACGGGHVTSSTPTPPPPADSAEPAEARVLVNVDDAGLALEGHDPVAFHRDGTPVVGSAELTSAHGGATYRFASAESKQQFDADPSKFAPRYGGYCAYAASQNRLSPVQIDQFEIYEGHLLMFTNQDFKQRFDAAPAEHFAKADAHWPDLVAAHGKPPR